MTVLCSTAPSLTHAFAVKQCLPSLHHEEPRRQKFCKLHVQGCSFSCVIQRGKKKSESLENKRHALTHPCTRRTLYLIVWRMLRTSENRSWRRYVTFACLSWLAFHPLDVKGVLKRAPTRKTKKVRPNNLMFQESS